MKFNTEMKSDAGGPGRGRSRSGFDSIGVGGRWPWAWSTRACAAAEDGEVLNNLTRIIAFNAVSRFEVKVRGCGFCRRSYIKDELEYAAIHCLGEL